MQVARSQLWLKHTVERTVSPTARVLSLHHVRHNGLFACSVVPSPAKRNVLVVDLSCSCVAYEQARINNWCGSWRAIHTDDA